MQGKLGIPVLAYHGIAGSVSGLGTGGRDPYLVHESSFRKQMEHLRGQGYRAAVLDEIIAYVTGKACLTPRTVAITFDDGDDNNYSIAYPLLKEFGFAATFFVIGARIGAAGAMTWIQLKQMSEDGMSIQSHTFTHAYLTELTEGQIKEELARSKTLLEGELGNPVRVLAAPGGAYSRDVKRLAREAGYVGMVTSDLGLNYATNDPFGLKRIAITRSLGLSSFACLLEGQGMLLPRLRQQLLNVTKRALGIENYARVRHWLLR